MKLVIFSIVALIAGKTTAQDPGCGVIPMSQWAGEGSLRKEILTNPVNIVIIQHTVTPEETTDEGCVNVLNAIRKYQRETMEFDDIGNSFFICGNGKVYEGTGWGLVGAHTKGYNHKSLGLSFIGEFSSKIPDTKALTAAKELIACGMANNHISEDYQLVGHRQVTDTVSPGDTLQKEIETWPHWTQNVA